MLAPVAPAASTDDHLFHFLDLFHKDIQHRLGQLHALATDLEADGPTTAIRTQARELVNWFSAEAREHHLDEEKHVFPALLSSNVEAVVDTTHRLIQDHGWLEADWNEIEPSLSAVAEGNTWFDPAVLRHAVEVFEQLYVDHIVLEESLAYPEARVRVDPSQLDAMGVEMAKRRAVRDAQSGKD